MSEPRTSEPSKQAPGPAQLVDASRRTYLAGERTHVLGLLTAVLILLD